MPATRRARLARALARRTGLRYQQALDVLDAHTSRTGRLPRTDAELDALAAAVTAEPAAVPPRPAAPVVRRGADAARALLELVEPGMVVRSRWPAHPHDPGPHDRVVVGVHRPGDPPLDDEIDTEDAAVAFNEPGSQVPSWLVLPDAGDDRDRVTVEVADTTVTLTTFGAAGEVTGEYRVDRHARAGLVDAAAVRAPRPIIIMSSDMGRCPILAMGADHYIPGGACAHQLPRCPTCAGAGHLRTPDGPVRCDPSAPVPAGVPVCAGTGRWAGQHR